MMAPRVSGDRDSLYQGLMHCCRLIDTFVFRLSFYRLAWPTCCAEVYDTEGRFVPEKFEELVRAV